ARGVGGASPAGPAVRDGAARERGRRRSAYEAPHGSVAPGPVSSGAESKRRRCPRSRARQSRVTLLEDLDHHRTAPAKGVERGGPVRPAPHAARAREQPEREDLLAEVAPVEPPPEDGLVHLLQLAEGETGREERVDKVGVRELGTQAAEGAADHGTVIVGEGR